MPTAHQTKLQLWFFGVVFLGVIVLAFLVFQPYLVPLATAAVFAVLFHPVYEWLCRRVKFPGLAAFLSTALALLLIVLPLSVIGFLLFEEARQVSTTFSEGNFGSITQVLSPIEDRLAGYLPTGTTFSVEALVERASSWIAANFAVVFAGTAEFVLMFFLGLIAFFYLIKDGGRFADAFLKLSPLEDSYDRRILAKLKRTITSVIRGSLFIAFLQGVLSGVGMWVAGIESAVLWGALAGIGALVPSLGTGIVLAPAVIYLFVTGSVVAAVGLTLWGFLVIGLVDNILLPKLISGGIHIHPLLLLFGVLGGLSFFGPAGILFGPLVISLLYVLVDIYFIVSGQKGFET